MIFLFYIIFLFYFSVNLTELIAFTKKAKKCIWRFFYRYVYSPNDTHLFFIAPYLFYIWVPSDAHQTTLPEKLQMSYLLINHFPMANCGVRRRHIFMRCMLCFGQMWKTHWNNLQTDADLFFDFPSVLCILLFFFLSCLISFFRLFFSFGHDIHASQIVADWVRGTGRLTLPLTHPLELPSRIHLFRLQLVDLLVRW